MRRARFACCAVVALWFCSTAHAYISTLPENLAEETLSESVPTAFAPNDFTTEDYALEWSGGNAIPAVEVRLAANSLEWVRVAEVLVVPRARLVISVSGASGGTVSSSRFTQALAADPSRPEGWKAELPVALISGERNPIEIRVRRGEKELQGQLRVRFKPRKGGERIFYDPSCSRFAVHGELKPNSGGDDWIYVGCRLVYVEKTEHKTSSLEMYVFWDGVGQEIEVAGIPTRASSVSVWPLRLRAEPGEVKLQSKSREATIHYSAAEHLHLAALGVGLGPYSYIFDGPTARIAKTTGILTLYGSYFVTESMRIVGFNATSFTAEAQTDLGLYLYSEYIRTLDRRIAINILLGAHIIGFRSHGDYFIRPGVPQGFEVVFFDFLGKARNLTAGAFIYPPIDNKAYYNAWLRWGSPSLFGEINYIAWQEAPDSTKHFYSRSLGISFGIPLAHFF